MNGSRIAYRLNNRIVIHYEGRVVEIPADNNYGDVLVTKDAVVWAGAKKLFMYSGGSEPIELEVRSFEFSSTDHYVTWYEHSVRALRVLRTTDGNQLTLVDENVINGGGQVINNHIFLNEYSSDPDCRN